jgi:serine-type D-Ala-D-Ala carboxypeptidase (penicillin-binding protein 5/6)
MRRAAVLVVSLAVAALAAAPCAAAPPSVARAKSAILVDGNDGGVLFQKDPDEHRAIASTTKLMTALLAIERTKPRQVLTSPGYNGLPAESKINLGRGERMTVHDLLQALLLESANDAAVTLAKGIAGSPARFVDLMNRRAAQLGLGDTSYANPIGLDDRDNYSTARDLARLASRLMTDARFRRIVDKPGAVLRSGSHRRAIGNRNLLVGRYPFVDGVKTGHTIDARYVLVGAADHRGARVVSVVLGEPSESARDSDTLALLRFGLSRFRRVPALAPGRPVANARVKYRDERVALVPRRGLEVAVRRGQRLVRRVDAPDRLEGPLPKGRRVGSVAVVRGRSVVGRMDLVTDRAVPGAGALRKVSSFFGGTWPFVILLVTLGVATFLALRLRMGVRLHRGETGAP